MQKTLLFQARARAQTHSYASKAEDAYERIFARARAPARMRKRTHVRAGHAATRAHKHIRSLARPVCFSK